MAVQNGFCSKQTASEKFYHSTPNEWQRILQEKHDAQMQELLVEEQRLDMQQENQIETQEKLADIQTEQQIEVIEAQADANSEDSDEKAQKARSRKGSVNTGRGRGRPNRSGKTWDENRNFSGRNNWDRWNASH